MMKRWWGICMLLCLLTSAASAAERTLDRVTADVTGDGIADEIMLKGDWQDSSQYAAELTIEVTEGASGGSPRLYATHASVHNARLIAADFDGDGTKDVMVLCQMLSSSLDCFAVSFAGGEATAIYGEGETPAQSGRIMLSDADNGRQLKLKTGSNIELRLKENPSTGYCWYIAEATAALSVLGQQFYQPIETVGMAGAPGLQVFTFKAGKESEGRLRLVCCRAWEGQEQAIAEFAVKVKIEN